MKTNTKNISHELLVWYRANARDLPWRHTRDPYLIWVSEIILQQTSVDQGLPYYLRFVSKFPKLHTLAQSDIDDVLIIWQGLGYYSRARNLHYTAQYILKELGGVFPNNYTDILKLKGIGPYTAAAIASFCFDESVVVVDGNVIRFISRLFGHSGDMGESKNIALVRKDAQSLIEHAPASEFNQAIMEYGALVCSARKPDCMLCCFKSCCNAFQTKCVDKIPHKTKKASKKHRFFTYAVLLDPDKNTLIKKRTAKDIWQGLYEFPLLESVSLNGPPPIISDFGYNYSVKSQLPSDIYQHTLTHQKLHARFVIYNLEEPVSNKNPGPEVVPFSNLNKYALPRLINLYLNDLSITLF